MSSAEKVASKYRKIEKRILHSNQIDTHLIIQNIKNNDIRYFNASKTRKDEIIEKTIQQDNKMKLLKISGKQLHHNNVSNDNHRIKSHSKDLNYLKFILDQPIDKLMNAISKDPDSKHFQRELVQIQKLKESPLKLQNYYTNIHLSTEQNTPCNEQNLKSGLNSNRQLAEKKLQFEDYEKMIINNPILYRKVMCLYKSSKRQLEKQQNIRKISNRRDTAIETRNIPKIAEFNKNSHEAKKLIQFHVYREFQLTVNLTNRCIIYPQQDLQYKAFICKGNNGILVKSILKSRPWWSIRSYSEIDNCNLVWTEWKRTKLTNSLPTNQTKNGARKNNLSYLQNIKLENNEKKKGERQVIKKMFDFNKIVQSKDENWRFFEKKIFYQNYLTFSSKINDQKFSEITEKIVSSSEYSHINVHKDHKSLNHLPGCLHLHSKKLLFLNMKKYYEKKGKEIFEVIPLTFLISKGVEDPQFTRFVKYFEQLNQKSKIKGNKISNIWICKPGENSNRGNGITVLGTLPEIRSLVSSKCGSNRTIIIQKYLENPFLYNKRKFDIRCYILITTVNGIIKGYWYEEGYIRTTSKQFNLKNLDNKLIHLTNDAVQKKGQQYGKFQSCNKVSFSQFQKYLETNHHDLGIKFETIYNSIKKLATDLIYSVALKLNSSKKQYSFEVFGLDFMLDDKLKPYLIEANSNPCLQVDGNVLGKVIPPMVENVIRVAIDPVFPPPYSESGKGKFTISNSFETNRMVLVYDSFNDQSKNDFVEDQKDLMEQQQEMEGQLFQ